MGMKLDCRFSFSDSYCAHRDIEHEECKDKENCDLFAHPINHKSSSGPIRISNLTQEAEGCPHRRSAIYCAKVGKFICNGPENCDIKD